MAIGESSAKGKSQAFVERVSCATSAVAGRKEGLQQVKEVLK